MSYKVFLQGETTIKVCENYIIITEEASTVLNKKNGLDFQNFRSVKYCKILIYTKL